MMEGVKGFIFDVGGVLEFQGKIDPGAVETINSLIYKKGYDIRFLTNTLKSRVSGAEKLIKACFRISYEDVITASYATAVYLKELKPRSCWIMLKGEGLNEFKDFNQDTENPEYIVIGDNRSKEHMNKALRLLKNGAKLISMIPGLVDVSSGECEAELNVGSWAKMLEKAPEEVPEVKATYIGKPCSYVFELTLKTMNLDKSKVVMVGDNVFVDIEGAKKVGMKAILLKTGEFNEKDLEDLDSEKQPDLVLDSIQDVLKVL